MATVEEDGPSERIPSYAPTLRDRIGLQIPEQAVISPTETYMRLRCGRRIGVKTTMSALHAP